MTVSVHVIGGFLGVGKTSAVKALLSGPLAQKQVAVVVNDFGESALDEVLLSQGGHQLAEIRGECVCCTAPDGFIGAVAGLLTTDLDAIVVEPTGLARPADLIDTLRRAPFADQLALGPLVVLCDPAVLMAERNAHLRHQAAHADVLVANRIDLSTGAQIADFDAWADGLWPQPVLRVHTTHGALDERVLTWPDDSRFEQRGSEGTDPADSHHHQHAMSRVWPPERAFHRGRLLDVLSRCAQDANVLRVKGLVRTAEGWIRVDVAGGHVHDVPTDWRRDTRMDLIGDTDLEAWGVALEGALLTEAERVVAADSLELALPDGGCRRFDRAALLALPDGVSDVSDLLPGRHGAAARLSALLASVGAQPDWEAVVVAADGYTTTPAPLAQLEGGLLIHSLAGEALPRTKGGPVRLMVPSNGGPGGPCANVKGVVRVSLRLPSAAHS